MSTNEPAGEVVREMGREARAAIDRAVELWNAFVAAASGDPDTYTATAEYLGDAQDEAGMDEGRLLD